MCYTCRQVLAELLRLTLSLPNNWCCWHNFFPKASPKLIRSGSFQNFVPLWTISLQTGQPTNVLWANRKCFVKGGIAQQTCRIRFASDPDQLRSVCPTILAHWLASGLDLFAKAGHSQPEPNWYCTIIYDPGCLFKNTTKSESGRLVMGQFWAIVLYLRYQYLIRSHGAVGTGPVLLLLFLNSVILHSPAGSLCFTFFFGFFSYMLGYFSVFISPLNSSGLFQCFHKSIELCWIILVFP